MSSAPVVVVAASSSGVRLPSWQVARRYDVALVPDLSAFTFQGHVRMTLDLTQPTQTIVLNSLDCTFPDDDTTSQPRVSVRQLPAAEGAQPAVSLPCVGVTLDAEAQRVTFAFGVPLQPGTYELSINYLGVLNDQLAGFYRSSYKDADGKTKYMAVTQFEATDARRALPCVDEPAAKALFDVTLLVSPSLQAVSNMPVLTKTTTGRSKDEAADVSRGLSYPAGMARYTYYTSPIMSTYLLAFVVGEFDYISKTSSGGTEVRVYTGLSKTHLGRFALDTAVAALEFYNQYFGIAYVRPEAAASTAPKGIGKAMPCESHLNDIFP